MPSGVSATDYRCKKCSKKFSTLSEMRKHQWKHAETYASVYKDAKHSATTAAISVRNFIDRPLESAANGEMTVGELLYELVSQRKFMDDMISMIGKVAEQHQRTNATK